MLFAVTYTWKEASEASEASEKRALQLFTNWTPPATYDIKAHYSFGDATGGILIAEVDSVATLTEATAPWGPFFDLKAIPVMDVEGAVPIFQKTNAWRDSVG